MISNDWNQVPLKCRGQILFIFIVQRLITTITAKSYWAHIMWLALNAKCPISILFMYNTINLSTLQVRKQGLRLSNSFKVKHLVEDEAGIWTQLSVLKFLTLNLCSDEQNGTLTLRNPFKILQLVVISINTLGSCDFWSSSHWRSSVEMFSCLTEQSYRKEIKQKHFCQSK